MQLKRIKWTSGFAGLSSLADYCTVLFLDCFLNLKQKKKCCIDIDNSVISVSLFSCYYDHLHILQINNFKIKQQNLKSIILGDIMYCTVWKDGF